MESKRKAKTESSRGKSKTHKVSNRPSKPARSQPVQPITSEQPIKATERRQAEAALRESEERYRLFQGILRFSSDGILAFNRENEVLFANDRFVELWMIPQQVMAKKDDTLLLQYVLDQLSDPQGFLQKVQELYNSVEESFDTLYFKDGRVFERLSRPMLQETELLGRVWSFRDVTERKQVEEALAEERYLLRTIIDFSPYEIFMKDRECRYTLVNANQAKVLGVATPAEAVGKTAFDFFPQKLAALFHEDDLSIIQTGQPIFDVERLRKGPKGEEQWRLVSKVPLRDTNGNVTGVVGIGRDITERKRAEEALATSEAELRALFAGMKDVVIVFDVDGRYIKIAPTNPAGLYRPAEEMLGKTVHEIVPKELADYFVAKIRESIQSGQVVTGEYTLQIGGKEIWRSASFSPLSETTVVLVSHDITARRRAEEALQRAEQRYRGLFEDAPAMYVITSNVEGSPVIADCNELFSRTLGFSRDELLGTSVADLYSPASRVQLLEGGYRRALAGEFLTEERELLTRDGRIVPTVVSAVPEIDATGCVSGTRAMFVDITERKQAEEELRRTKDELETVNLELQQALEREKLLACTDGLTGLCNHRHFFELADREFHAAIRYQHPLAFLMFDMDDFKHVNDTLGHTAGDKLLAAVAQTAVAQVRASDVVARYGGDEFIVMLPHAGAQQALPVAERIRASVAAIRVDAFNDDKEPVTITLSIGIADMQHKPVDGNVERVIQRADDALYKAKQSGRNRTVIFGQDETGATR